MWRITLFCVSTSFKVDDKKLQMFDSQKFEKFALLQYFCYHQSWLKADIVIYKYWYYISGLNFVESLINMGHWETF